ncbi:hypothetical protein D9M68_179650 [compost metagenome]
MALQNVSDWSKARSLDECSVYTRAALALFFIQLVFLLGESASAPSFMGLQEVALLG